MTPGAPPSPDLSRFLSAVWADSEGLRCVSTLDGKEQRKKALDPKHKPPKGAWDDRFFLTTEEALDFASSSVSSSDVYFSSALFSSKEGGRKKDNAAAVAGLWADLDFGKEGHHRTGLPDEAAARAALDSFRLPPSAVIHTGGGLSAFWFLREPHDLVNGGLEAVEAVNRGLAAALGGDAVADVNRVMRAPGGFNFKHDPPRPTRLLDLDPERRYNLSDFADFVPHVPASTSRPAGGEAPGIGGALAERVAALPPLSRALVTLDLGGFNAEAVRRGWHDRKGKTTNYPSRSERDFAAVGALVDLGWNDTEILEAFEALPVGERFWEKGPADLERALRKFRAGLTRSEEGAHPGEQAPPSPAPLETPDPVETSAPAALETPKAAASWKGKLLRKPSKDDKPGGLERSIHNALVIFRDSPEWSGVLAFDSFAQQIRIRRPPPYRPKGFTVPPEGLPWGDNEETLAAAWLHENHRLFVGPDVVHAAAVAAAMGNEFHPVRDYLEGLRWDGTPRVDTWLLEYLGAKDTIYHREIGPLWLISAVARIFRPGCKADHVLILEGPQGIGKSTALRHLAPEWFTDELAELGSKDAAQQLIGVWIVELSELDSMNRPEISRTKLFFSKSFDKYRPPYGRNTQEFPRQCVFAGSVNHADFLKDETGGRRFWPVTVRGITPDGKLDTVGIERDRAQLWAEAVHLYRAGRPWWIESKAVAELAAREQDNRFITDPWEPIVEAYIEGLAHVTRDDIFEKLGIHPDRRGPGEAARIGRVLAHLGWTKQRYRPKGAGSARSHRYLPPVSTLEDLATDGDDEGGTEKDQSPIH